MVAGTYTFDLSVTDSKGVVTNSSPVKIVVKAAGTAAVGSAANAGQAIFMTDSAGISDSAIMGSTTGLRLYPNPARDLLNIRLSSGVTGKVIVAVFNTRGTRVLNLEANKASAILDLMVDVSRLPAGMYMIEIVNGPEPQTIGKFIKQ